MLALLFVMNVVVLAQNHWICTCFRPQYDRGCCHEVGYEMMTDGNVCDIDRADVESKEKFKQCCYGIKGTIKCK